jgi:uncharacterized protein YjbI with pentapeptide repeats
MTNVDVWGTSLRNADLRNARLGGNFGNVDFGGANLRGAQIGSAAFDGARYCNSRDQLRGIVWAETSADRATRSGSTSATCGASS